MRSTPLFTNVVPHSVPKSVTSISLYQLVLLDALQLAAGATGLFSQGVTAVVHGCSACALGHNLGEETGFTMATLQEGSENARNHMSLKVEPFIVLSTSYSDNPPLRVGISSHGYHQT